MCSDGYCCRALLLLWQLFACQMGLLTGRSVYWQTPWRQVLDINTKRTSWRQKQGTRKTKNRKKENDGERTRESTQTLPESPPFPRGKLRGWASQWRSLTEQLSASPYRGKRQEEILINKSLLRVRICMYVLAFSRNEQALSPPPPPPQTII